MHQLLQTKKARIARLIGAVFLLFIVSEKVSLAMDLHTLADSAHNNTSQKSSTGQAQVIPLSAQQNSLAIVPNSQPTGTLAAPATSVQCGQGGTTGNGCTGAGLRYFAVGTAVSVMQAGASALPKQLVKALLEKEIDNSWGVVQSALGFSTKQKAYAFFLGMASRESTLNAGLETGSGAGHSYGPIQVAETAYANANPSYTPEHDVPEMTQYAFTPQNFYDPGIATYMGIRHLIHFSRLAKAKGYRGSELLRHALMGYNTGYIDTTDQNAMTQYSDEIGAMAGWYLHNGHLYDTLFTWTGDPGVDRSQPWRWY
jgi:hypothetical protein